VDEGHISQRESKLTWQELLRDLKQRGLTHAPKVAIGYEALGFWAGFKVETAVHRRVGQSQVGSY
tara:strand:+ start:277 stop:471 length:195 start_codon:yes stop_codon:yes gene_type:complete